MDNPPEENIPKTSVLIVDDNAANLLLLESLLKGFGWEVTTAENGREALEKARAAPPALIISDILMPVMDGYNLCREWRADAVLKPIPFIFYTATYTDAKDEEFALSLGADRFVIKPQDPAVLMKLIDETMEKKSAPGRSGALPLGEDMEFFRRYNGVLFRKLEKKIVDLEIANQKLKILEENYRLSFENVTDVVYSISSAHRVLTISPSVEKILGYSPAEFIGRPITDLYKIFAPESLPLALENMGRLLRGERNPVTNYQLVAKDGSTIQAEVSGAPLVRENKVVGLIAIARNVTDRLLAEENLRQSEKKYRDLYDFLPIPVYEMDLESNLTSANRAIFKMFGGSEEDLTKGIKAWQMLTPEAVETSRTNIQRMLRGERVEGTEYTLRRLDESTFPAIIVSSIIHEGDKPVGLRGAIVDITERKKAEEKLRSTLDSLNKAVRTTIQVMVASVEARDPYTSGHQLKSAMLAEAIAAKLGFPKDRIDGIRMAASIHDIGKLSIPAEILSKPSKLTPIEFSLIKEHPETGYEILKDVTSPWPLAEVVLQHHERMDGSGYPRGLRGDEILLEARILGVADVVEAMASHRPYRPSLGIEAALQEIEIGRGVRYDPAVVAACLDLFRKDGYRLTVKL